MWKLSLACNTLLMCVFGLATSITQIRLTNAIQYDEFDGLALPPLSQLTLNAEWIAVAVPAVWVISGLILLVLNWKREEPPQDIIQLHTSITLLVGITMLTLFAIAGILPFVSIIVKLS